MATHSLHCPKCGETMEENRCRFCKEEFSADEARAASKTEILQADPTRTTVTSKTEILQANPARIDVLGQGEPTMLEGGNSEEDSRTALFGDFSVGGEESETRDTGHQDLVGKSFGNCQVIEKLGQGGMGTVYKAHHKTLDQFVVLKALAPSMAQSEQFRERFIREARACARLHHQNVVQVLDAGHANGVYFYLMEFVDGYSLDDLVSRNEEFSPREACRIIRDAATGLEVAHGAGIVHRDIKASNIMVTKSGQVKVADFGLACDLQADRISLSGQLMGTPQYMSPEQWDGQDVDARSDLYSLGITFYCILTGKVPFHSVSTVSLCKKHAMEAPRPPGKVKKGIPPAVDAIVMRLLAKKQDERYQSARELILELNEFLSGNDSSAFGRKSRKVAARMVLAIPILALVCLAAFLCFGQPGSGKREPADRSAAEKSGKDADPVAVPPDSPEQVLEGNSQATPSTAGEGNPERPKIEEGSGAGQGSDTAKTGDAGKAVDPGESSDDAGKAADSGKETARPADSPPAVEAPLPSIRIAPDTNRLAKDLPLVIRGEISAPLPKDAQAMVSARSGDGKERRHAIEEFSAGGRFQIALADLEEGDYEIFPEICQAGGAKKKGKGHPVTVDLAPPALAVETPEDGAVLCEEKSGRAIRIRAQARDRVAGVDSVRILAKDREARMRCAEPHIYEATMSLDWGRQSYTVVAADKAGREVAQKRSIVLVPSGMVRVPELTVQVGGQAVRLKAFYMDRTEVTNEAYEEYLRASGNNQPLRWLAPGKRPENWKRLPVVFVTHEEATSYARFHGKRLPGEAEWVVAALWSEGEVRGYPWGNDAKGAAWPRQLLPVGSWTLDRSAFGVLDTASGVSEWTCEVKNRQAMRKGGCYDLRADSLERMKWAEMSYWEPLDRCTNWLGFRCVFSEESH